MQVFAYHLKNNSSCSIFSMNNEENYYFLWKSLPNFYCVLSSTYRVYYNLQQLAVLAIKIFAKLATFSSFSKMYSKQVHQLFKF